MNTNAAGATASPTPTTELETVSGGSASTATTGAEPSSAEESKAKALGLFNRHTTSYRKTHIDHHLKGGVVLRTCVIDAKRLRDLLSMPRRQPMDPLPVDVGSRWPLADVWEMADREALNHLKGLYAQAAERETGRAPAEKTPRAVLLPRALPQRLGSVFEDAEIGEVMSKDRRSDPTACWSQCLQQLRPLMSEQEFNTWMRPLQAHAVGTTLVLYAPNQFVVDWLRQRQEAQIIKLMAQLAPHVKGIELKVGSRPALPVPIEIPSEGLRVHRTHISSKGSAMKRKSD